MYITSDLFAAPGLVDAQKLPPSTSRWNMGTERPHPTGLGKRRRRADSQHSGSVGYLDLPKKLPSPRKASTKHHGVGLKPFGRECCEHNAAKSTTTARGDMRPIKQARRVNQAVVADLVVPLSHLSAETHHLIPTSSKPLSSLGDPLSSVYDVRPCHICYKSPMRRRDLESYTTCPSCAERVCHICTRRCAGGCLRQICSTCSKEIGEEGIPLCLQCLSRDIGNS